MTEYNQTRDLIMDVLALAPDEAREFLNNRLVKAHITWPQFYDLVILHGPSLGFTSDQWLDFHLKIPHWRLLDDKGLMDLLSVNQREQLGHVLDR